MNKILSLIAVGMLLVMPSLKADSTAVTLNGNITNLVLVGPIKLLSVSISSSAITNGLIAFLDSPNAFPTNWSLGYTNKGFGIATTNYIFTNVFGVLTTNRWQIISNYVLSSLAHTNYYARVASVASVSNAIVTLDFDSQYLANGLLVTNIAGVGAPGNITLTIQYDQLK